MRLSSAAATPCFWTPSGPHKWGLCRASLAWSEPPCAGPHSAAPANCGPFRVWQSLTVGVQLGPLAGGLLYEYAGYFQAFLPALAMLSLDIALRLLWLPPPKTFSANAHVDAGTPAETSPLLPSAQTSMSCSPARCLLTSPRFLTILTTALILHGVPTGLNAVFPIYLRETFDQSSGQTALFFVASCVPMLFSPFAGMLTDRVGSKTPAALAFAGQTLGSAALVAVTPALRPHGAWWAVMLAAMGSVGCGLLFGYPALNAEVPEALAALAREIEEKQERDKKYGGAAAMEWGAACRQQGVGAAMAENRGELKTAASTASTQAYAFLSAALSGGMVVGPLGAGLLQDQIGWTGTVLGVSGAALVAFVLAMMFIGSPKMRARRKRGVRTGEGYAGITEGERGRV